MLRGTSIDLRLIRESDLAMLYERFAEIATRGAYFPTGLMSEPSLRAAHATNGFWTEDQGMLVIVDRDDEVVGEIEFYRITHYLQGYELSYQLFGADHAGKGYTTEAVALIVDYLFGRNRVNRIQLNIHPQNLASKKVAEKCGFTLEGVMRQCWFHDGRFHDLEIWSLLREEVPGSSG